MPMSAADMTSTVPLRTARGRAMRALLFTSVALLIAPAASAADFGATRAHGDGGTLASAGTFILGQAPRAASFQAELSVDMGSWRVVDEVVQNGVRGPANSDSSLISMGGDREIFSGPLESSSAWSEDVRVGGVLLVMPAAAGHQAEVVPTGSFAVAPAGAQIVERSHVTPGPTITRPGATSQFEYYEYANPEGLRWSASSGMTLRLTGDFDVYLWDVDFTIAGPDGTSLHRTGFSSEPREDTNGLTVDDHYRYAILEIRGGSLTLTSEGDAVSLFAPAISTEATQGLSFEEAEGSIPTTDGILKVAGPIETQSGSFLMRYRSGGMDVDVTKAPASATGPYTQFTPSPLSDHPAFLPAIFGAVALVGLCASAYSYPTLQGTLHLRLMENLTGRPRARGWRAARAEGYALRAAAAEDAGHRRRAALWMVLATRLDPHDPEKSLDAGIFLAAAGRDRRAMRHFKVAHQGLFEIGDLENVGHNAYEAAKASSRLGRRQEALDWLRIAAQADPGLLTEIRSEPSLHALRDEPDYSSLTVGEGK